jgi:hypothetical protein
MNNIGLILIGIALFVIAGIAGYIAVGYMKKIENEARYQCAMSVRYEVTENGSTISYPPEDLYEDCLSEKGL